MRDFLYINFYLYRLYIKNDNYMIVKIEFDNIYDMKTLHDAAYRLATKVVLGNKSDDDLNHFIVDLALACGVTIDDFSKIASLAFYRTVKKTQRSLVVELNDENKFKL